MADLSLCRINRNDAQRPEVGDPGEHPILVHFFAASGMARRKISAITKELKHRSFKTRHRSWNGGSARFCAIATNAPPETAKDVASDHFPKVELDLRSMSERIAQVDSLLFGNGGPLTK